MNKEEFLKLHTEFCKDTCGLSFTKRDHPAYVALLNAGEEIIPWLLERLRDSIGHDEGDTFDASNSPWLSTDLLFSLSNGQCFSKFPRKHAGVLDKVRAHILKWGKNKFNTNA
jgi:hypothetical protein